MSALEILALGIVATLATDAWQRLLQTLAGIPAANWALVGRWVAWLARGEFVHRPIAATHRVNGEAAIGWAFHYAVGVFYAAIYLAIMRLGLNSEPTLASALIFAIVLLVAPWFILQPALGLGFVASHAPNPVATRAINVSVHAVFGLGLYLGGVAWRLVAE
jgi:hypothetical protein